MIELIKIKGTWRDIANSANTTIRRESGTKEPSSEWKRKMLLAEHSPIRQLIIKAKWKELKYWVSVHLVRHKFGVEHWVRTQRSDRTNVNRDILPQGNIIEHEIEANAQAIISISRKRLCNCASKETREAWIEFLDCFKNLEPELYSVCVPDCIYRGHCYEFKSCGYHKKIEFIDRLLEYRGSVNMDVIKGKGDL